MRDNNLMKDGDWMTKMEAARDNLPEHFTKKDIRTKIEEVRGREGGEKEKERLCIIIFLAGSSEP